MDGREGTKDVGVAPSQNTPGLLQGPLWCSGFIGFTLLLVSGATYLAILQEESLNPRRNLLEGLWPSVVVGDSAHAAVKAMGPPDRETEVFRRVRGVESSSGSQAATTQPTERHTCVREYTWYSWQTRGSGLAYIACVDREGTVRQMPHDSPSSACGLPVEQPWRRRLRLVVPPGAAVGAEAALRCACG